MAETDEGMRSRRKNLWAPWRIKYIQGLGSGGGECFICHHIEDKSNDDENLVLWRTKRGIVLLNRYPYNNGHLLVAPVRHIAELEEAEDNELMELLGLVKQSKKALTAAIKPHGFNIGVNIGRCAGAGLPGHLHFHIVPRWEGDTNFINVCSDTDVISQSLMELLEELRTVSRREHLPGL